MRYVLAVLTSLAWAIWLGGLMALFLFVSHLFSADRATAIVAAPRMFVAFERVELMLAAVCLVCVAVWRLAAPSRALTALFALVALAALGVVISAAVITPRIEQIRKSGRSDSPEFRALHGKSMIVYTSQSALLLIAGFILPAAMARLRREATPAAQETAPPA